MKIKFLFAFLAVSMMVLAACSGGGSGSPSGKQVAGNEVPETGVIRWNSGTSGNVLVTIANTMGYFKEYGLTVEEIPATAIANAMMLLSTGQVDVVSNSGTSNPLQQIASGVDLVSFGGHMVTGAMPVVARKGTKWNGPQDLIGKRFACNPVYFAFTGAIMDLGYSNPLEVVDWVIYSSYPDALAALVRGEVDYALMGTGENYAVQNMDEVEIVTYHSAVMPNYSCCRMVSRREFLEKNPTTVKLMLKALIRAQRWYEAHREESVELQAKVMGVPNEYVAAYMLNRERYVVSVDPLKNSVVRAWNILAKTGFLADDAKNIDILNHIDTKLFETALNEVTKEFGNEDPEFYKKMQTFFEEQNK